MTFYRCEKNLLWAFCKGEPDWESEPTREEEIGEGWYKGTTYIKVTGNCKSDPKTCGKCQLASEVYPTKVEKE